MSLTARSLTAPHPPPVRPLPYRWVWVYGLLVGLVVLVAAPRSALFFIAAVQASTHIHDAASLRVMRAPLAYFHTNPVGRMLNRCKMSLSKLIMARTNYDSNKRNIIKFI